MCERRVEEASTAGTAERRKILVVGIGDLFTEDIMGYAVHLAERLDYDLLALSVCSGSNEERFRKKAQKAASVFRQRAGQSGIRFEHVTKSGDLGSAVEELNHVTTRIEFVVTDSQVNRDEVTRVVTVPMFSVISSSLEEKQGGEVMGKEIGVSKSGLLARTLGYGAITVALYAAVFLNSGKVMEFFTKGSWFAVLPIATVFVFSFAHGAFASNLWSLLGIEAMKKGALRETEKKVVEKRKQATKKPRAYAYVNPFHRIDR